MKISSIPQLYRNLRRWQEIISVLRRYGLADWLSKLKFDFIRDWIKDEHGVPLASYSREKRVRLALTDLGPTFIKLGQVLSLRPDLIGTKLADELTSLQSHVPADSPEEVRAIIERELECTVEEAFDSFEWTPIASASIGQVHAAKLKDGSDVVVKVQHADIESTVREDLEVMAGLATLAEHLPELEVWKPTIVVEQLSRSLQRELDFSRELHQLQLFRSKLQDVERLHIPAPYPALSTDRVLTMQRLRGAAVADLEANNQALLEADRFDASGVAKLAAEVYVEMIFTHGIYHADPHPGNVLLIGRCELGLLDFGMVGRIDDRLRETIEEMMLAVASQDAVMLTTLVKRVGKTPPGLDESILSIDVADIVATYGAQPLDDFNLSGALREMTEIMHRHQISLPPQTSLLIKMLITLEGTLRQLSPQFSLLEVMQPFFRKMWFKRFSPRRQLKRFRRISYEVEALLETLPNQISNVMQLVQDGKLDVHLAHKGLSPSVNRLVLGLLISSVFLGSSLLLSMKVPPLLFSEQSWFGLEKLSVLGLIGYALSSFAGWRLIRAINRSGHLDRVDSD